MRNPERNVCGKVYGSILAWAEPHVKVYLIN